MEQQYIYVNMVNSAQYVANIFLRRR